MLAADPVRWVRNLRPPWVALEQVPAVLPLWEAFASIFRYWGYATRTGILDAADYGAASLSHPVGPPAPTHYDPRRGPRICGTLWTSMADTIGWGMTSQPAPSRPTAPRPAVGVQDRIRRVALLHQRQTRGGDHGPARDAAIPAASRGSSSPLS
jgi:hypothetical protein